MTVTFVHCIHYLTQMCKAIKQTKYNYCYSFEVWI